MRRHQQMALRGHLSAQHIKRVSVSLNQGASEPSPSGFPSSQTDKWDPGWEVATWSVTKHGWIPRWLGSDPPAVGWISWRVLLSTRNKEQFSAVTFKMISNYGVKDFKRAGLILWKTTNWLDGMKQTKKAQSETINQFEITDICRWMQSNQNQYRLILAHMPWSDITDETGWKTLWKSSTCSFRRTADSSAGAKADREGRFPEGGPREETWKVCFEHLSWWKSFGAGSSGGTTLIKSGAWFDPLKPFLTSLAYMNKAPVLPQKFRYLISQFICERWNGQDKCTIAALAEWTLANRRSHRRNSKVYLHLRHKSLATSFITFH